MLPARPMVGMESALISLRGVIAKDKLTWWRAPDIRPRPRESSALDFPSSGSVRCQLFESILRDIQGEQPPQNLKHPLPKHLATSVHWTLLTVFAV